MLWLPTAAAELRHVIRLRYIRPVWMNNEECLSLQNIPASLPLPRARPKLGHAGPPELGQWGERAEGWGEHRGDWRETGAPLHATPVQVCSEKGGFFGGETSLYAALEMCNIVQIFPFFESQDNFLKIVGSLSASELWLFFSGVCSLYSFFFFRRCEVLCADSWKFELINKAEFSINFKCHNWRKVTTFALCSFKENTPRITPASICQRLHLTC